METELGPERDPRALPDAARRILNALQDCAGNRCLSSLNRHARRAELAVAKGSLTDDDARDERARQQHGGDDMGRGDDTVGDIQAGLVLWEAWSAPPAVRAILAQWAEPCDAASLLPRGADPAPLQRCYRALAAGRGVGKAALVLLYENAEQNRAFGLWADLRAEAACVLDWLAPLLATIAPETAAAGPTSPVRPIPRCTSPDSSAIA